MTRLREGRLATVLTYPLTRIVLGLLAFLVLLVPAQAVAGGVRAASLAGVLLEIYVAAASGVALWMVGRVLERRPAAEVGLGPEPAPRHLVLGLLGGVAIVGVAVGLLALTGSYRVTGLGDLGSGGGVPTLLLLFLFQLAGAVLQAILFFGLVFRILLEWLGRWPAVGLAIVFFAILHLSEPNATPQSAMVIGLGGGGLLAAAYLATRNVWLPAGLLWGLNFTAADVLGSAPSAHSVLEARMTGSEIWTGGAAGIEGSLAILLAVAVVGLALGLARRRSLKRLS